MDDDFSHEYDTVLNAWIDSPLSDGSVSTPGGRRDHTLESVGDLTILIAGIDNDEEALQDMWNINFSKWDVRVCGVIISRPPFLPLQNTD